MSRSPVPSASSGASYDKLLRSISFLQNEKSMMLQEIQSLKSRLASMQRINGGDSPAPVMNSVNEAALQKLLEENLHTGTRLSVWCMKTQITKRVAGMFFRWKQAAAMMTQALEFKRQVQEFEAERMRLDSGVNPWKNTAMTLLARERREDARRHSKSPNRSGGRSHGDKSGTDLHLRAWGSRAGTLDTSTGVSASSSFAWKKDTTPEDRVKRHYRFASHKSSGDRVSSSGSVASSPPKFRYNYSSSFLEQDEGVNEFRSHQHEHVPGPNAGAPSLTRGRAPRRNGLFYNAHEIHPSLDAQSASLASGESKGEEGHPSSSLAIDTSVSGESVQEREHRELKALHKHITKHDTHHDTLQGNTRHVMAPALLTEDTLHEGHASSEHHKETRSQAKKPQPRYLNPTANFRNGTYRFYSHNNHEVPDFGLEAPSSPREMQEYHEGLYHRRRELNLQSRSRSSSPTNRSRYENDSVNESNSFVSGSSYRRSVTARYNNYGQPQFVSPARRAHSADAARRRVTGAARNMTSPMLQPEPRGRSMQSKLKSKPAETFGGVPSYMTPTFSSMHQKVNKGKKAQISINHAIEHSAKHSSTFKAEQIIKSGKHFAHYSNEAEAAQAEVLSQKRAQPHHVSKSGKPLTKSSKPACTPSFMQDTFSAKGTHKSEVESELKARVRAQHDLEHSKEKSITYSREHLQGKDFSHANNKHLLSMSGKHADGAPAESGDDFAPSAPGSTAPAEDQSTLPPELRDDPAAGGSRPHWEESETSSKKQPTPAPAPAKLKAKTSGGAEATEVDVAKINSRIGDEDDELLPAWGSKKDENDPVPD